MNQESDLNEVKEKAEPIDQEFDIEKFNARMEKMEATNARLLEESQSYKTKYRGLRDNIEKEQTTKLEENENWKELLDVEKNKRSDLETQLRDSRKSILQKELGFKVASLAKDAHNVNDILGALPKDMLAIDEDNHVVNGVDEAVNYVRENKPYLFAKNTSSGMMSGRPDGAPPKDKTLDERINENPNAVLNEVLANMLE